MSVMMLHFLSFKIVTVGYVIVNRLPRDNIGAFPAIHTDKWYVWILYSMVGIFVPLVIAIACERVRMYIKRWKFA